MLLLERVGDNVAQKVAACECVDASESTLSPAITVATAVTLKAPMNLLQAEPGSTYSIRAIRTEDDEMNSFLFRLGAYSGEPITLVSKKKRSCIVVIKAGRYSLDAQLAEAIIVDKH